MIVFNKTVWLKQKARYLTERENKNINFWLKNLEIDFEIIELQKFFVFDLQTLNTVHNASASWDERSSSSKACGWNRIYSIEAWNCENIWKD